VGVGVSGIGLMAAVAVTGLAGKDVDGIVVTVGSEELGLINGVEIGAPPASVSGCGWPAESNNPQAVSN
jgi:hypothetical protein